MRSYKINPAGLAYIAERATELTGQAHAANSPATYAYASAAEDSADNNDRASAAMFEIRSFDTLSGRPEEVWLDTAHVDVAEVADE